MCISISIRPRSSSAAKSTVAPLLRLSIYLSIDLSVYLSIYLSIYLSLSLSLSIYIYIYIYICPYVRSIRVLQHLGSRNAGTSLCWGKFTRGRPTCSVRMYARFTYCSIPGREMRGLSEGGMIRLETLIELKVINSSFSSLSSCWN